ncbi:MAG: pyrroline-5-carboxylate reductase family protein, partial [Candidatus Methanodesulfokora sp.]
PRDMAYMALLKLIEGTIKNLETGVHPIQLRDLVTTPAGTTIAGMSRIIKVKEDIIKAVRNASKRAEELGAEVSSRVEQSLKFPSYQIPKPAVGEVNKLEFASKLDEAH